MRWKTARRHTVGLLAAAAVVTASLWSMPGCAERPDDGRVRLELWTLALRPHFTDYMQGLVAGFEAANPGVEVEWVDVPYTAMNRKLVAAAAAGRAPDVVNLSDRDFARFASLGAMADIRDRLPGDPHQRYLPGVLRIAELGDELLGLPWYLTTVVALCHTGLLEAGGMAPADLGPTWAALREQARAYHRRTGGFLFTLPLAEESELPQMLLGSGLPLFRTDGQGRLVADLTHPRVVREVGGWVGLYREGALPREAGTSGHEHVIDLYQNGRVAVIQTGANMLGRVRDAAIDVYERTAVREPIVGELGRVHVAVMLVGVTSTSAHPEEAAALAWWLTGPEAQLELARRATVMPSTVEVLDDPYFRAGAEVSGGGEGESEAAKIVEARAMSASMLREAVAFTPALETWPDMRRAFNEMIKRALLSGADVGETLARIEGEWNRLLRTGVRPATMDAVPTPPPVARASRGGE